MKRTLDLLFVFATAPLWVPLALLVALLVRICDGRPVLYIARRAGKDGEVFRFLKFRTMRAGVGSDVARLTRLGRILRTTSLDEIPQLLHVLSGKMSLVGPRPLPAEYLPRYSPEQARRHEVRPGLTGWAQVNGRNALTWEEKFACDVWYVDNRSCMLDLKILLLTLLRVVRRTGVDRSAAVTMPEFRGGPSAAADAAHGETTI